MRILKRTASQLALALGFSLVTLSGQTTMPASTSPANKEEDVLKLSVFTVNADKQNGYQASNSVTATGMGEDIVNIPVSITVMTDEFIKDKGGFILQDVLNYAPGVQTGLKSDNSVTGDFAFSVRGFPGKNQIDGYDGGLGAGATFGVDRVEVIKGPSSVFNGIISPGGLINVIYKKPSFTPSSYVEAKVGSYEDYSLQFMSTGPLHTGSLIPGKVAYLIGAKYQDAKAWRRHFGNGEQSELFGITYLPIDAVTINLNVRNIENDGRNGALIPRDRTGFDESGLPWNYDIFTWITDNFGPNPDTQFDSVYPESRSPEGYRFNAAGPQNFNNFKETHINPELTVRINNHIEARYGYFHSDHFNEWAKGVSTFGGPDPEIYHGAYGIALYRWERSYTGMHRAEAVLRFDTGPLSHKMIIGGMERRSDNWTNYRSSNSGLAFLPKYNPWTDPEIRVMDLINSAWPNQSYKRPVHTSKATVTGLYVADQIVALDNRLRFLVGARQTKQTTLSISSGNRFTSDKATPQFGVLARPFSDASPLKGTTIFANYSKTFEPVGRVDAYGKIPPPAEGVGKEIGIKTEWLDGKLSGTISYFENEKTNVLQTDYEAQTRLGIAPIFNLGGEQAVHGAEVEMYWTPSKNMQIGVNYTYLPTAETTANTDVPQQVGVRFGSTPIHRFNAFGKYTFTTGKLQGMFVGGGLLGQGGDGAISGVQENWTVSGIKIPGFILADAFVGYKTKYNGRDLTMTLSVKNLFNHRGFTWDAFNPAEPIKFYFTTRLSLF